MTALLILIAWTSTGPAPVAAYRPGPACYHAAAAYPQAECRWAYLASPVNTRAAAPSLAPARSPVPLPDPRGM